MIGSRFVPWLARHPIVVALVTVGIVWMFVASRMSAISGALPASPMRADMSVAGQELPTSSERPPRERVGRVHQALHALGKECKSSWRPGAAARLRHPLSRLEAFAGDYPAAQFRIDGEHGTTLALLIVVWNQLKSCDQALAGEVERLIPPEYRGG